ncbi:MAG: cytochrome P460 family protein [Methylococcaceae bacterium]|nr:cytochrome P460 family protein [Methylococcaceae bacterium]
MKSLTPFVLSLLMLAGLSNSYAAGEIPYPDGYRNWFHVKSMVIKPGHPLENPFQGIHHVYANAKAASGLKNGTYAEGAILVFDLLNYADKDQSIQEGARKLVGIMHKDAKKYASTGGWGFDGFAGDSKTERLVKDGGTSCYGCHASEKKTDYVFSQAHN